MDDDVVVRVGTPADIDACMELSMLASAENGFIRPNRLKMVHEIYPALALDAGIVGVIDDKREPGKLEGAVLLRINSLWYSDDLVLEERAVFVHPDFRAAKVGRARKLCEFSKMMREKLNLPLMIGVLSNQRTEGKVRLYKRIFGEPAGAYWLVGAETGVTNKAAE